MADPIEAAARAYGKKFPLVDLGALVDALTAADAARIKDASKVVHMLEEAASSEAMDAYGRDEVSRRLVREAAALITAQTARIDALEMALKELLEASEADCGTPGICDEDDEAVGASQSEDGTIEPMATTFGTLRHARATLEGK